MATATDTILQCNAYILLTLAISMSQDIKEGGRDDEPVQN